MNREVSAASSGPQRRQKASALQVASVLESRHMGVGAGAPITRTKAAKGFAFCISVAYAAWLLLTGAPENIEPSVSVLCLNVSYAFFVIFGISLIRRRQQSPALQRSWSLLVAATVALMIAEVLFILRGRPALSIAEPFYFAYYFLFFPGLLLFPFAQLRDRQKVTLFLDLAIVLLASLLLLWYFLIDQITAWIAAGDYAALANMSYPVLDMLILAAGIIAIQRDVTGLHPAALLWLILGSGAATVTDVFLSFGYLQQQHAQLLTANIMNVTLRFIVLLSVTRQIAFLEGDDNRTASSRIRNFVQVTLPYAASGVILLLLAVAVQSPQTSPLRLSGVLFGTLALIAIVLFRQHLMLRENIYLYTKAEEARKIAENATKAKAEFLANMSHEIRTPMHGVIGVSELLLNSHLNDSQKELAETLRSSGNSLMAVINDVLDFSKIDAGMVELESKPFDLHRGIDEALATIRMEADKKKLRLSSHVADSVPAIIQGDRARVRAILLNLLSNAVKYTHSGEVALMAQSRPGPNETVEVEISVRDTGVGIAEELQGKLFQPFSQIEDSSIGRHTGTGLGLVISKRLCELMGGRMWISSRQGEGSTFSFTFITRTADTAPPVSRQFRLDSNLAERVPLQILVAEDNLVHQKVTLLMLQQLGYGADIARNGMEALQMCRARRYDMIFLDMRMPDMDGLETARRIRSQSGYANSILIAHTASAVKGDREKCLAAGMNEMLTKPMLIEDLRSMIQRWGTGVRDAAKQPGSRGAET